MHPKRIPLIVLSQLGPAYDGFEAGEQLLWRPPAYPAVAAWRPVAPWNPHGWEPDRPALTVPTDVPVATGGNPTADVRWWPGYSAGGR